MLEPLRAKFNGALGEAWEGWEISRIALPSWSADAKALHAKWWEARFVKPRAIDTSIAAKAGHEYLYDRPYGDKDRVRVAGPFTV